MYLIKSPDVFQITSPLRKLVTTSNLAFYYVRISSPCLTDQHPNEFFPIIPPAPRPSGDSFW